MSLVDVTDFEARLGRSLAGDELSRAVAAVEDASRLVLEVGDVDWTDASVPDVVKTVVLAVARRAFDNPDGAIQKSVGDVTLSYGGGRMGATIYLTKEERRIVRRSGGAHLTSVTLVSPYTGIPPAELEL